MKRWWWTSCGTGIAVLVVALVVSRAHYVPSSKVVSAAEPAMQQLPIERVQIIRPASGGILRKTVQPGSAHSFQHAALFAKVSGYLKTQNVDIGARVKRGEVLAELDVPELVQELERNKARSRQAEADVTQAESQIASVVAEHRAALAYVAQAKANVKRCESQRAYREKQYERIRDLHEMRSVEARLVDEELDQLQSAQAAELAAECAVTTATEQASAASAKVGRARADLVVTKAHVEVVQTEVSKAAVLLSYTRITSPYDGVVTLRSFHPGDFIRAADQGEHVPLLSVDRTDLIRVVVQVPDRDVPYTQPGDRATMVFDALPGHLITGRIARIAASEDRESRTMRVEVDVPNPQGLIRDGMYGQMEIDLEDPSSGVTIPSGCLVGDVVSGRGQVYVVEQSKAHRVEVKVGKDDGALVEVLSGLTTASEVIVKPPTALADGTPVNAMAGQFENKPAH